MGSRVNPVVLIGSYSETETGPWGTVTTKELVGLIRQLWPHSSQSIAKQTEIQPNTYFSTKFHPISLDSSNSISTQ